MNDKDPEEIITVHLNQYTAWQGKRKDAPDWARVRLASERPISPKKRAELQP